MRLVGVALVACIVGLGFGLLIGRHFPAHGYQKYGETRYLLDSATGKLCDPFKDPKNPVTVDPFAAFGGKQTSPAPSTSGNPIDQSLSDIWKQPYPPPCK
jgi:hypothetical protein